MKPTIVLETICGGELWIWHEFFGIPGILNDINVIHHSPTMEPIMAGYFPTSIKKYWNGRKQTIPCYLVYGIYQNCSIFIKTIKYHNNCKEEVLSKEQESERKDIERSLGF